jgi:hypothetical protein
VGGGGISRRWGRDITIPFDARKIKTDMLSCWKALFKSVSILSVDVTQSRRLSEMEPLESNELTTLLRSRFSPYGGRLRAWSGSWEGTQYIALPLA